MKSKHVMKWWLEVSSSSSGASSISTFSGLSSTGEPRRRLCAIWMGLWCRCCSEQHQTLTHAELCVHTICDKADRSCCQTPDWLWHWFCRTAKQQMDGTQDLKRQRWSASLLCEEFSCSTFCALFRFQSTQSPKKKHKTWTMLRRILRELPLTPAASHTLLHSHLTPQD